MVVVQVVKRMLLSMTIFWFFVALIQVLVGIPEVARMVLGVSAPIAFTIAVVKSVEKALYR